MAVSTLGELVTDLKLEVGHSSSAATGLNMRDQMIYLLNRVQNDLAEAYDFPGMTADRDIPIVLAGRYYNYPADMPFDNVNKIWLVWNTLYAELKYGIGPEQFALFNSNTGFTSWPVQRWKHNSDDNLIELWPVPNQAPVATSTSQAALIRVRGTRVPPKMVADADRCVLPDKIILLWTAAEIMAREGDKGATLKQNKAMEALRRYKIRQSSHKKGPFVVGGGSTGFGGRAAPRIGIDYIPEGYGNGPGT